MKAKSKGRYQGLLNDLKELTIERDATYVATDGADNSITNAQMAQAVSDNKAAAFYQVGNTYVCIDSGTYTQNHIYKFTGAGWEDVTPIPTNVETTDNKVSTITTTNKTSTTKYPSVKAIVDYADALDSNAVHTSGTETVGGVKTFSSGIKVAGASGIDTSSSADLVIKRYGTSQLKVTSTGLAPTSNNAKDLGNSSYYFKDLYIKGQLKDGTNNISLADIPNDSEVVHTTGDETVAGVKTFTNGLQVKTRDDYKWQLYNDAGGASLGIGYNNTQNVLQKKFQYTNTGAFRPESNNAQDLGISSAQWKDLYLSGNLTDGTNSVTVADLVNGGSVSIDNVSITENDDGEIQAIGVIDQNTGNANKEWTGTRAAFEDIAVKDNNTTYYVTDDKLINVGNTTTTIETVVYPTITKAKLDEIYARYTAGNQFVLLWQPLGINTYFSVVYASDVDAYELHMIIHGKVAKYSWNNQTSGLVIPTLI